MSAVPTPSDLVLDELLDLTLYRELQAHASGPLKSLLGDLVEVEKRHLRFWQDFFDVRLDRLDLARAAKLRVLVWACRLFGAPAIHMTLEAIEVYGIRKYLALWEASQGTPTAKAVRSILEDELQHEDTIVSRMTERKIDPERVRSLILGFNDGLVEILGAVTGFFASLREPRLVLMASASVAVAGAFSMAAGAFASSQSEGELERLEAAKARALGRGAAAASGGQRPLNTALVVGVSYFFGSMVPVLPVVAGAASPAVPFATAFAAVVLVSAVLAFLSGMEVRRRIATNVVVIAIAVAITYSIGAAARSVWGIDL